MRGSRSRSGTPSTLVPSTSNPSLALRRRPWAGRGVSRPLPHSARGRGATSDPGRSQPRRHRPGGRRRLPTRGFRATRPPSQHMQPLVTHVRPGSSRSATRGGPRTAAPGATEDSSPSSAVRPSMTAGWSHQAWDGLRPRPLTTPPAPRAWDAQPHGRQGRPSVCLTLIFAVCAESTAEAPSSTFRGQTPHDKDVRNGVAPRSGGPAAPGPRNAGLRTRDRPAQS